MLFCCHPRYIRGQCVCVSSFRGGRYLPVLKPAACDDRAAVGVMAPLQKSTGRCNTQASTILCDNGDTAFETNPAGPSTRSWQAKHILQLKRGDSPSAALQQSQLLTCNLLAAALHGCEEFMLQLLLKAAASALEGGPVSREWPVKARI